MRSDTSFAKYEDRAARGAATIVSGLSGSYKVPGTGGAGEGVAAVVKLTFVEDSPPTGHGGAVLANPVVGGAYALKVASIVRLNFALGFTVPVGGGGGNAPDAGSADARNKGPLARAAMDNAIFGVNDFGMAPGIGLAVLSNGFTAQAEATVIEGLRVRGEKAQHEATKTNFTSGVHVGYFVIPMLSLGAELRYQRWLDAPFSVEKDATDATRDTLTVAFGPRANINLSDTIWFRPGIAYARGLDKPMAAATPNYHIVQLDLPLAF